MAQGSVHSDLEVVIVPVMDVYLVLERPRLGLHHERIEAALVLVNQRQLVCNHIPQMQCKLLSLRLEGRLSFEVGPVDLLLPLERDLVLLVESLQSGSSELLTKQPLHHGTPLDDRERSPLLQSALVDQERLDSVAEEAESFRLEDEDVESVPILDELLEIGVDGGVRNP